MNFIAPYSHYFYKAMHLIGTPNEQSVFLCLWGRAMAGCKNKQTLSVKASVSQIAKSVRCSWGTVNNVLKSLKKKKFITSYDDSTYTIDAKRFMAINATFEGLSKINEVYLGQEYLSFNILRNYAILKFLSENSLNLKFSFYFLLSLK